MSEILRKIDELVLKGAVRISDHAYDEMAEDDIFVRDIVAGTGSAAVVEEYPDYAKGPCVLVLQHDGKGLPLHVVWGIPKGRVSPAVVVTAYRPDPARWAADFKRRRR